MALIQVEHVKKSFETLDVLKDVSFLVNPGDVIAIIGSSGSGKSTLLRCLIHLENIDGGSIIIAGKPMVEQGVYAPPAQIKAITAQMGMVFQHFHLFPHLNVEKNLTLPLMLSNKAFSKQECLQKCQELLQKVGLLDKLHELPSHLSGGQKQRVAIARALMLSPQIMLFDEPTSALDPELTAEVLVTMRQLAQEKMTMIVVTHEMEFAQKVASRVLFMDNGEIVEEGTPQQIFESPRQARTQQFLRTALH